MNSRIAKNKFRRRDRIVLRDRPTVYHIICRSALKQFLLDPEAKDVFQHMLFKQARFTGLKVLTYCLMDNHLHLLVKVPVCPMREDGNHLLTDDELIARYFAFYGEEKVPLSTYSLTELKAALAAGGAEAEEARRIVLARMGDLPAFMRELKQRFTIWYNAKRENVGTIWSARYKSLVVENSAEVLTRVAAYIDLNPIRAGIEKDPAQYRWSGYSAGLRGHDAAREGLCTLFPGDPSPYEAMLKSYRLILFGIGTHRGRIRLGPGSKAKAKALNPFLAKLGQLTKGIALGSRLFVESLSGSNAGETQRRRQAHPIAGDPSEALFGTRQT